MQSPLLFPCKLSGTLIKKSIARKVGIGTNNPQATFDIKGGLLLDSTNGNTPVSGAGTRLMWIPSKWAFRAGKATGSHWDEANIGENSFAFGSNDVASGNAAISIGNNATASNNSAVAIGNNSSATGASLAIPIFQIPQTGFSKLEMGPQIMPEAMQ